MRKMEEEEQGGKRKGQEADLLCDALRWRCDARPASP